MRWIFINAWSGFFQKEEKSEEKTKARLGIVYVLLASFFLFEIGVLYYRSGAIKGVSKLSDKYREAVIAEGDLKIQPGNIFDRNGNYLVNNNYEEEKRSVYADDFAYSQVIGFTGPMKEVIGVEVTPLDNSYRFMEYYEKDLYHTVGIDGMKGNSLTLTLDHELTMAVKEALLQEMPSDEKGSAIVLNAKTGEILSMVSFPVFNTNNLKEGKQTLNFSPAVKEMYFPITHKNGEAFGSCFKIFTTVALIDNGMSDFRVNDIEFLAGDAPIRNDYPSYGANIDYKTAFIQSSNVYFAKAALELGADVMTETAKKFMIGEELELDFGTVISNWDLSSGEVSELAYTGFGQGKTLLSTIHAAMMVQAIANDGKMLEPYLVKNIFDENHKIISEGKSKVLSTLTSKDTANKVTEVMKSTAEYYSSRVDANSKRILLNYSVAGKTGTAQIDDNTNSNNAWFVSFAPANDPQYVVVVNQCNTTEYGIKMIDTACKIYQYLFEEMK